MYYFSFFLFLYLIIKRKDEKMKPFEITRQIGNKSMKPI